MKQLLQIGAGNIGRGLIGRLFYEAGFDVVFADVDYDMIDALNQTKSYRVIRMGQTQTTQVIQIKDAINSTNQDDFNDAFKQATVITTAVGPSILKYVANNIVSAIKAGNLSGPKTILACENYIRASSHLKTQVYALLDEHEKKQANELLTFNDVAVDCIVPPSGKIKKPDVCVEDFYELVVETNDQQSTISNMTNIMVTTQVSPYVERKLYTLNGSHALTAYLGYFYGHETIEQAIYDQRIEPIVRAYLAQVQGVLIKKHGFDPNQMQMYANTIINRFKNPYLHDQVTRVGRELLRKLGRNERFMGPLQDAINSGLPHDWLIKGIAIALCYQDLDDLDVQVLHRLYRLKSEQETLQLLTGLTDQSLLDKLIQTSKRIEQEGLLWIHSLLI